MTNLESQRLKIRPLLHFSAPSDALAIYYAFYHDPRRTRLHIYENENSGGRAGGFAAVCQTGQRLFQPTVVLRTPNADAAIELLRRALAPGRPYYLITTLDLRDAVAEVVDIEQPEINHVYRLELFRLKSSINVLVVAEKGPNGLPRFVIRSREEVAAESGVSWSSPHFAELYVRTIPAAQGRGWGQTVLAASTTWAIRLGRQPLYVVNESNDPSLALAKTVGYVDTGVREFAGGCVCRT